MKKMKKFVALSAAVLMLAGLLPLVQNSVKGAETVEVNCILPLIWEY